MARRDVWVGIYSALNVSSILSLLGSQTATNNRLYIGWPQEQPVLSNEEPDEGFIAWYEDPTTIQEDTVFENMRINFEVVTTRATTADAIIDQIDSEYNWRIPQQRTVKFGDQILLQSKRVYTIQKYDEDRKLHQRTARYWMQFIETPYSA